jgi:hypothetical protein
VKSKHLAFGRDVQSGWTFSWGDLRCPEQGREAMLALEILTSKNAVDVRAIFASGKSKRPTRA